MSETKTVWHPYPKEMPKKEGEYLITSDVHYGSGKEVSIVNYLKHNKFGLSDYRVTAWAEKPEPYMEEQ